jgi:hypothetical protein
MLIDGVAIVASSLSPTDRAEALDFVVALLGVAKPGPWRDVLEAVECDLIAGARNYDRSFDRGLARLLDGPTRPLLAQWGDPPTTPTGESG